MFIVLTFIGEIQRRILFSADTRKIVSILKGIEVYE